MADPVGHPTDRCRCGHDREEHAYDAGRCWPACSDLRPETRDCTCEAFRAATGG